MGDGLWRVTSQPHNHPRRDDRRSLNNRPSQSGREHSFKHPIGTQFQPCFRRRKGQNPPENQSRNDGEAVPAQTHDGLIPNAEAGGSHRDSTFGRCFDSHHSSDQTAPEPRHRQHHRSTRQPYDSGMRADVSPTTQARSPQHARPEQSDEHNRCRNQVNPRPRILLHRLEKLRGRLRGCFLSLVNHSRRALLGQSGVCNKDGTNPGQPANNRTIERNTRHPA